MIFLNWEKKLAAVIGMAALRMMHGSILEENMTRTVASVGEALVAGAIFTIPAKRIVDSISDCVGKGVKAGLVISAGFAELGDEGRALQAEMVQRARAGGMVLIGPNGQGIAVPRTKLYPWMPAP